MFDTEFADDRLGRKMMREYSVPDLFPKDLFACMGEERQPFR